MRGLTPQRTFIAQSKKMGMTHLALTETNGLWGFIHFVQHARDADILPIAGANILTLQDDVIVLVETKRDMKISAGYFQMFMMMKPCPLRTFLNKTFPDCLSFLTRKTH